MPTPVHVVRVDDSLWQAAAAQAQAEGTTISDVIRRLLQWYVHSGRSTRDLLGPDGEDDDAALGYDH